MSLSLILSLLYRASQCKSRQVPFDFILRHSLSVVASHCSSQSKQVPLSFLFSFLFSFPFSLFLSLTLFLLLVFPSCLMDGGVEELWRKKVIEIGITLPPTFFSAFCHSTILRFCHMQFLCWPQRFRVEPKIQSCFFLLRCSNYEAFVECRWQMADGRISECQKMTDQRHIVMMDNQ